MLVILIRVVCWLVFYFMFFFVFVFFKTFTFSWDFFLFFVRHLRIKFKFFTLLFLLRLLHKQKKHLHIYSYSLIIFDFLLSFFFNAFFPSTKQSFDSLEKKRLPFPSCDLIRMDCSFRCFDCYLNAVQKVNYCCCF